MDREEALFQLIVARMTGGDPEVTAGKMMSSPGIKFKNKVFAFFYRGEMVFRLGKDFKPESAGLTHYSLLNPFKSKPPLAGWFQIPFVHADRWPALAENALAKMRAELARH